MTVRYIAVTVLVCLVAACGPVEANAPTGSSTPDAPIAIESPDPASTTPTPSPEALAFFEGPDDAVVTFAGIGPVVLGASLAEIGDDLEMWECGGVSGLPDNVRIELDDGHDGSIVRIDVYAPDEFDDPDLPQLMDVRALNGIRFGDDVDAVADALGASVVVEEVEEVEEAESALDEHPTITLFQVTLRETVDGVDRVMTINFGRQREGDSRPDLKVAALQVAVAGHEGPPWHRA